MKRMTCLLVVSVVALAGCAPARVGDDPLRRSPSTVAPEVVQAANTPMVCQDKAQCDLYWQRAQYWLSTNSHFKIQSATDAVITTFGPQRYGGELAYSVRKEVSPTGGATIHIVAMCDSPKFGCFEHPLSAIARAKTYIAARQ